MKKKAVLTSIAAVLALSPFSSSFPTAQAETNDQADELFFSEYIEGSSFNKAVEIYNGTGEDVDLADYEIELYSNGSSEATGSFDMEGMLENGDVFVTANSQAGDEILDAADATNNSAVNFNGDDPLVLKKNDEVVDSIGQIGSNDEFGSDVTLIRKEEVKNGDTNPDDEFSGSEEWNSYAADTFDYLGTYELPETEPVELQTIEEARGSEPGSTVKVEGTVTGAFDTGGQTNYYIQDDTAGIIVRVPGNPVNTGDQITVSGEFSDYYGMQQILASSANMEIVESGAGVPTPQTVTSNQFADDQGEEIEGELVRVEDVEVLSKNSYGDFTVEDENGEFVITPEDENLLEIGSSYEQITGVVNYSFEEYKLVPRDEKDIVEVVFAITANPQPGSIVEGGEVELNTAEEGAAIHYTTDGSTPDAESQVYEEPITIEEDTTIQAVAVRESGEVSPAAAFSYEVLTPVDEVEIHDIQGTGHTSPYEDEVVENVSGIVTKLDGSNGFYMQSITPDNDVATSEGIYVYNPSHEVEAGDEVSIGGEVTEWQEEGYSDADDLLTTQISASDVEIQSSDNQIPDPVVIGKDREQPTEVIEDDDMESFDPEEDGLDFYESLEGMLVAVEDATVSAPISYDELSVYADPSEDQLKTQANGLLISPEDYNPERIMFDVEGLGLEAVTGDQLDGTAAGVVSYDYSNFKIRPAEDFPELRDGDTAPQVTELEGTDEELSVGTYNMENFSAETNPDKAERIGDQIANNMKAPDIVGLVEVQDNNGPEDDGTVEADESYEALIQSIEEAGGPSYEYTDIAPEDKVDGGQPGGNIRVGYIYNPERVSLTDKTAGDASTAVDVNEEGLSHNPGRIDPDNEAFENSRKSLAAEFEFDGETFILVNNHFNSKGGDDALFGASHPVELGSEDQRIQQAEIINDFVQEAEAGAEDANVVVMGDLNDFEFSNPLQTLKGNELANLMENLPSEERYSYIYQGNSQTLDHILVSNSLEDRTKIDAVHINADFSEATGRASDHDPVVAQINTAKQEDKDEEKGHNGKAKGHEKGKGKGHEKGKGEGHKKHH
ncbi:chitobiase/beta-hexosaminidase C-terminal domain-containing protein [Halobacillus sp. A5]|uniref:chitobiase/beta-hexosaminidase C-terminal domain-containing protein n=1 Tax=Halobacillus sp. A5 TaxID=2880263 RepID=UPI0020A61E5D|nr:chitobiase/beta-hexosaminidase C-terminal domain-containing protein [Halobacillus sp. A5]MCP3028049.1 chitobiase/beta-hexosaminidase C-terminal domain-containing protein [Halobacillus sp. A5]